MTRILAALLLVSATAAVTHALDWNADPVAQTKGRLSKTAAVPEATPKVVPASEADSLELDFVRRNNEAAGRQEARESARISAELKGYLRAHKGPYKSAHLIYSHEEGPADCTDGRGIIAKMMNGQVCYVWQCRTAPLLVCSR